MRNIFKSLLVVLVAGCFLNAKAYNHVGLATGTVELGTISKTPGAGSKFGKYTDGAYLYRGSAYSFSSGKGIKTQNSNSGVVFYLANSADITVTVMFDASKNFANVDAQLSTISDSDYDKFFTGTDNSTAVTFSKTDYQSKTVVIDQKGNFQETFSAVPAGYYYIVCTGTGSNTYFTQLIVGGSTPVTPTVSSVTVSPTSKTLEINDTQQLTATVSVTPSTADNTVRWSTSDANVATVSKSGLVTAVGQGTATITAASNLDNTKSATCAITVNAPAAPIPVAAISLPATATVGIGATTTLTVSYTPTDANTGKVVTWSSANENTATVDASGVVTGVAAGTVTITATTANGKTATCSVTVQAVAVTGVSLDKTSASLQIGGSETLTATVTPAEATNKNITWESSNPAVATVNNGQVKAIAEGSATITVKTVDGNKTATCSVSVTAGPPVPSTSLTTHEPEIYEAKEIAGGYNGTLSVVNGREYEVYYTQRTDDGDYPTFAVNRAPEAKTTGISGSTSKTKNVGRDGDLWFEGTITEHSECKKASSEDEFVFETKTIREHRLSSSDKYQFHIKGFDQFSLWGMDKKLDPKNGDQVFVVKVDGKEQTTTYNADKYSIRRYNITTGEHVIEISTTAATKTNKCAFGGFSLRVSDQPRVRWLKGNDSTQTVLQTQAPKAVYYFTKYSAKGETILEWEGQPATGITLEKAASSTIGDTLVLGGVANCPVGEYKYNVVTYMNGAETSRVSGKLNVTSDIKASSDTLVDAYQGEEMEVIEFRYYALSANDVQLTWTNGTPTGITGDGVPNTNKFAISGTTSAKPGKYTYSITVNSSSTVITGYIEVISQNLGDNPVLYLYQTKSPKRGYDNDGVYSYLKGKNVNLQPRTTINKLRSKEQYSKFKWILISDDVNADNAEVLEIARGGADLPVLNMKGFTYTEDRLGWGEPDNGSIDTLSNNGQYIYVQQAKHPIFNGFNAQTNPKIKIFDGLAQNGVMPINIDYPGSFALATAYTRNIEDYYKDGEMQTIIHEIPAGERNNKKYICFPLSISSSNKLSSQGKILLTNIVDYLISSEAASMTAPKLEMTAFKIGEYNGTIDQTNNTVDLVIDTDKYPDLDLKALKPIVSVADPMTHVSPASGAEVDFQYSLYMPVDYVVTDFINRRVYEVVVRAAASQGIEEVYSLGDWVNIYDVFGRKVATTNENIFTMELPKGMYIIVTENGNTLKIMR